MSKKSPETTLTKEVVLEEKTTSIQTGAQQTSTYLSLLKGKKIGVVANQTSVIYHTEQHSEAKQTHLVDSLLSQNIEVIKVFAPEHGFRGKADAGEIVKDGKDTKTGLPILSLYGKNKKPSAEQLSGIDLMIFDIQDVGARFYTYISTLHYIMEACAENNISLLILDRPNPNGHYTDGPILEKEHKSFVGMHPIPIVHGMTIGEYAKMINGEKWLENGTQSEITIIECANYSHDKSYDLPIKPSPNLPNAQSINLYPSLCLFEGTPISVGRGTNKQFQVIGEPGADKKQFSFYFTPQPNEGAKHPKHEGKACYGYDLSKAEKKNKLDLSYLIEFYRQMETTEGFFKPFFVKLAGTKKLQEQIEAGLSEEEIKASWKEGLDHYNTIRKQYLLYQ
ncbi:MAG: DUF1343 domain-containing protein [Flavobacteriaceae bacterium]|nr:DUF1343 domain-containing protein [Flavobacteriaceae bacterium]